MKKNILSLWLSFIFIIVFSSCEESIPLILEGEERYSAQGRVVDDSGVPLADIWVCIRSCNTSSNCEIVGIAKTDENGYFRLIHSGNVGRFYALHINDPVVVEDSREVQYAYHNASYKFSRSEYVQYQKDFGDVGYLKKGTWLTVICNGQTGGKPCKTAIYSHQMDTIMPGMDDKEKYYKYYSVPSGKSIAINVPLQDTVFVEYKKWQRPTPFFPVYTWYRETLIMEGAPKRIFVD